MEETNDFSFAMTDRMTNAKDAISSGVSAAIFEPSNRSEKKILGYAPRMRVFFNFFYYYANILVVKLTNFELSIASVYIY